MLSVYRFNMPRTYVSKSKKLCQRPEQENISKAIEAVNNGKSFREAAAENAVHSFLDLCLIIKSFLDSQN